MYLKSICFLVLASIVILACNSGSRSSNDTNKDSLSSHTDSMRTGTDVEPILKQADSLQILYYDDPDGDSLRYSRFFTYTPTRDSNTIRYLLLCLEQPFVKLNAVKDCRSEGKIYMFDREGPLKTIYFSTRCDSCCYLYFIKSGAFLYFPLSDNMKRSLKENKAKSQKP